MMLSIEWYGLRVKNNINIYPHYIFIQGVTMNKKVLFSVFIVCLFLGSVMLSGCVEEPNVGDGVYESPNGAGVLQVENGVRVLKLSGSNYEMGYAHGYLLAEEIIYTLDNFVFWSAFLLGQDYDELVSNMQFIDWQECYEDELQGMLDGIRDRLPLKDRKVHPKGFGKEVDLVDLKIANSVSDWGCSSFSSWGNATFDGSLIFARNLDYYAGRNECFKKMHLLVSFDDGISQRWVTASICGFIGCISGMNEQGMVLALHDTNHFSSSSSTGYVPRCLILRKMAEQANESWTPAIVADQMESYPGYLGMNLHVCFPALGRTDDKISGIVEFDGNALHDDGQSTLRIPTDNDMLPVDEDFDQRLNYSHSLICTNHYLKRKTDIYNETAGRYVIIKRDLAAAKADGNVSIDEALEIMEAVGDAGTIHTTLFRPDQKRLHFYLAEVGAGGFDSAGIIFDFDDFFV